MTPTETEQKAFPFSSTITSSLPRSSSSSTSSSSNTTAAGWFPLDTLATLQKGAKTDIYRLASVLSDQARSLVAPSSSVLKDVSNNTGQMTTTTTPSTTTTMASASASSSLSSVMVGNGALAAALQRQEEFNRLSLSLAGVNYMMNMASRAANNALKSEIDAGKLRIEELEETMQDQSILIEDLNDSVAAQGAAADALRRELAQQHRHIMEQQRALGAMEDRAIRYDGAVDVAAALVSLSVANFSLIDGPLRLILAFVPKRRLRRTLRQSTKLAIFLYILRFLRRAAQGAGIHSGSGRPGSYAALLGRMVMQLWYSIKAHGGVGGGGVGVGGSGGSAIGGGRSRSSSGNSYSNSHGQLSSNGSGSGVRGGRGGGGGRGVPLPLHINPPQSASMPPTPVRSTGNKGNAVVATPRQYSPE